MEKVPIDVPDDMLKFAILAAIHAFGSSDVRNAPEISTQAIREIVEAVLDWQKAHAPNKLTRGVPPVRRSTFIPKDQVETFARDEPKVSFTVNGIDDPPEALSGNYAGRDKSVPIYTPTEIDLHAVPIEIKDIISWFMVYFGDSPEIENMKRNVILAFMRGFEAAM